MLNVGYCDGISDISALGNVHTLNITGCHRISNVYIP
jgi:hypothetical protein